MSDKQHILAIVEPDVHPAQVVRRAAWLAKLEDCDLTLLLCDPDVGALREGFFVSNEARDIAARIFPRISFALQPARQMTPQPPMRLRLAMAHVFQGGGMAQVPTQPFEYPACPAHQQPVPMLQ